MSARHRLWMIGAGNMGGAMLRRWIDTGTLARDEVLVLNRSGRTVVEGVESRTQAPEGPPPAMAMLGVKPQMIDHAPAFLRNPGVPVPLLISILAGVDMATLADRFAAQAIVRAMPNLPVAIGKGVVALHGSREGDVDALMRPLGLVERIEDEALFDVVTALAGSGPGFTYRFIDALAAGAAALGLPADQALRLARATVDGSASLAAGADEPPATLADRVASPGGSTRAGLNILDADGALAALLTRTLDAATRRNAEMAAEARR